MKRLADMLGIDASRLFESDQSLDKTSNVIQQLQQDNLNLKAQLDELLKVMKKNVEEKVNIPTNSHDTGKL